MVAYVPYLTLLLPGRMAALAPEARVEWLGAAAVAGAVSASAANIAFGWASDVIGTRRGWAGAGLFLTVSSYGLLHAAATAPALVAAIVIYQVALNMLLSALAAWAADRVPDGRKGLLGGLLGAGPPIGALAGVVATLPILSQPWMRLAAVCALMVALTTPLLLSRSVGEAELVSQEAPPRRASARADFALLWAARLLVQIAGNALFGFSIYYFQTLPDPPSEAGVARLSALTLSTAFPIALVFGRLSDRLGPRKPFLIAAAVAAAVGLGIMAAGGGFTLGAGGYALFGCAGGVFLALHAGFSMQLLPSPTRRGRDLGVLNLANTLPAAIAPLLAIWLVPGQGFGPFLATLAGCAMLAGFCVLLVRRAA